MTKQEHFQLLVATILAGMIDYHTKFIDEDTLETATRIAVDLVVNTEDVDKLISDYRNS